MDDGRAGTSHGESLGSLDLHVHTNMSDGDLSLEEVVAVASARGVTVGIADHVSNRNSSLFVADRPRLDAYLAALDRAPVYRSGELCWCDSFSASLPPELLARFDYLVGSNHGFDLPDGRTISPWSRTLPEEWRNDPHRAMDVIVEELRRIVETMPISIIGHPTLLPPALLGIERDVEEWWTEEREDRFIRSVVRAGVALEISNRYRLPHDRFLRRAKAAGARFSLGSDGHTLDQVARLDWAIGAAEEAGITAADLFVPERRIA